MSKNMKGNYSHSIDAKGRVIIPSKIRDILGREFVMTLSFEDCIYLYSQEEWDSFTDRLRGIGNKTEAARNIRRFFQANARDAEIDTQGRTLIPAEFRDELGIDKEVVIIGNGEKAEIWNKATWDALNERPELTKESIKKALEESDIDFF